MKRVILLLWLVISFAGGMAQDTQVYENGNGEIHLCGPFNLEMLENDTTYKKWFRKGYSDFDVLPKEREWVKNLKDVEVDIYLGTWCGDSKKWVPSFVKLWDELGLERQRLHFTGLYDMIEEEMKYKQGPNREEKGKNIHRVPTFIFTKNGQEIARMVEYPVNDMETDLAQIALGFPSKPNYRGATYMYKLFDSQKIEDIKAHEIEHLYAVYELVKNPSELNTLGYVLLESGRTKEALLVFYFNTRYFKYDPNVYDSYAEALEKDGQTPRAIEMYEKVLLLDRSNSHAKEQIEKLKEKFR